MVKLGIRNITGVGKLMNDAESMATAAERLMQEIDRLSGLLEARLGREAEMAEEIDSLRAGYAVQAADIARLEAEIDAMRHQRKAVAARLDGTIARVERLAMGAA